MTKIGEKLDKIFNRLFIPLYFVWLFAMLPTILFVIWSMEQWEWMLGGLSAGTILTISILLKFLCLMIIVAIGYGFWYIILMAADNLERCGAWRTK